MSRTSVQRVNTADGSEALDIETCVPGPWCVDVPCAAAPAPAPSPVTG